MKKFILVFSIFFLFTSAYSQILQPPQLLEPTSPYSGQNPPSNGFKWTRVTSNAGYRVSISTSSSMSPEITGYTTSSNIEQWVPNQSTWDMLPSNQTCYWSVKTHSAGDNWSIWATPIRQVTRTVSTIQVTVTSNYAGSCGPIFRVNGGDYNTQQTITVASGSAVTLGTYTPQSPCNPGLERFVYSNWSNSGSMNQTVYPTSNTTYTVNFTKQYYLFMNISPSNGGSSTPSEGWFNSGSTVQICATSNLVYNFSNWIGNGSGSYTGVTRCNVNITMNASVTETAYCTQLPQNINVSFQTYPSGLKVTIDGTEYTTPYNASWVSGTNHTINTNSPQSGGTGTQYVWTSWTHGGNQSQTVSPTSNTDYTCNFKTQYKLTMSTTCGGIITPPPGEYWYDAGTQVQISVSNNFDATTTLCLFTEWLGEGIGCYIGELLSTYINMNGPITQMARLLSPKPPDFDYVFVAEYENKI